MLLRGFGYRQRDGIDHGQGRVRGGRSPRTGGRDRVGGGLCRIDDPQIGPGHGADPLIDGDRIGTGGVPGQRG